MNQNINHAFKVDDLDWEQLENIGINRKKLEKDGNLELLLKGKETDTLPLKIHNQLMSLTMDATLKLTEGANGKPVMEINGLQTENKV